ncbi:hypothetical protein EW145_g8689, partial [Phellinidium pouzarii]
EDEDESEAESDDAEDSTGQKRAEDNDSSDSAEDENFEDALERMTISDADLIRVSGGAPPPALTVGVVGAAMMALSDPL